MSQVEISFFNLCFVSVNIFNSYRVTLILTSLVDSKLHIFRYSYDQSCYLKSPILSSINRHHYGQGNNFSLQGLANASALIQRTNCIRARKNNKLKSNSPNNAYSTIVFLHICSSKFNYLCSAMNTAERLEVFYVIHSSFEPILFNSI